MRRTSVATYNAIIQSGALSAKRMAVYDYLYKNGPLTGGQLQKALGGGVSESIRNRVTELVKMGAVYEVKETKCPVTGRSVLLFDVTENMPKEYEKPKSKNEIIKELKEKCLKLKSLILFTDPILSSEQCGGEIQLKQWQEFIKCFPDEGSF